ncbi:MAG: efflux RND transporter permease subunit [Verrucomicrobiota bacterium]|nr:efflux RND transporter permease subunit [Verrucomicrobiota bacterium]
MSHLPEHDSSVAGRLARFSLDRRVTVFVLLMTVIVLGIISAISLPMELFPRGYQTKFLSVFIPFPNAPAEEVLEKITKPVEEELSTVKQLASINSWSGKDGANIFLRFKSKTDIAVAYREVRDRMERARSRFPEDVERYFIQKHDPSGIPVAVLGVAVDPTMADYYSLVEKKILLPLSRIDGVANVELNGMVEKEVIIELDKQKADAFGLNIYQLAQELERDNFTMAGGHIYEADKKFLLRSIATYTSIEDFRNRPINDRLKLKDIATIRYEQPEKNFSVRLNAKPAAAIIMFKEGEANSVELGEKLEIVVEEMMENPLFADVEMNLFFNQGKMVQSSIFSLIRGGQIGGALAGLVLFFFLRRFRLTIIVTLSIPLSLMMALVVMYLGGETLNMLSILGLVICVGLLVDNSVVVAENIYRHMQDGSSPRTACIQGAREIALAITMATLTTIIVFLPVSLVEGEGQFFLMRLALPISVALSASLVVAIVFIPLSVFLTLRPRDKGVSTARLSMVRGWMDRCLEGAYQKSMQNWHRLYHSLLHYFLIRRMDLVILLLVVMGISYGYLFQEVDFAPNQEEDRTSFRIGVEMSRESIFDDTAEYFAEAEKVMLVQKEKLNLSGVFLMHFDRGGSIEGWLDPDSDNQLTASEMAKSVLDVLPKRAGVKLTTGRESETDEATGREVHVLHLVGDDAATIERVSDDLEPIIEGLPGVVGIRSRRERSANELGLVLDRDRVESANVNPEFVAGVVGYALRGRSLPRFQYEGREIPVRIRFEEPDRERLTDLSNFQVPTRDGGGSVPISALTDVKILESPGGINRRDKRISRSITIDLDPSQAGLAHRQISELTKQLDLPEGVSFGLSLNDSSTEETIKNLRFAAMVSVLFIYLLMGFLFESFVLPLSIILTIPLAGIGVVWSHWLTGKDLDVLGFVGAILLIGVVVNNGIVLVDYVNRLRQKGLDRTQALLQAADRRFRPILMTALTTIIGMIPLTFSQPTELGLSYKSFGLTLIGGMTTATILTLLVVPVFYTFFDDLRERVMQGTRSLTAGITRA